VTELAEFAALVALGLDRDADSPPETRTAQDADEVAAYAAAAASLADGLAIVEPPAHVRARLMAALGDGRFEAYVARFAALYDLAAERARELLSWIESPSKWLPATPGVRLIHFRGGGLHATADCGVLRVAPGTSFPWHSHSGEEHSLFLAGAGRDHNGRVYLPGDELILDVGTAHDFSTISDDELIIAVRYHGVDFTAQRPSP
jgi:quercetin dioxygenase-like cupin family protein